MKPLFLPQPFVSFKWKHESKKWNSYQNIKSNSWLFNCQIRFKIKWQLALSSPVVTLCCTHTMYFKGKLSLYMTLGCTRASRVRAASILIVSTRRMWLSSFIPCPVYARRHNTPLTLSPKASLICITDKSLVPARNWTLIPVTYPVSFSKLANPDFEGRSSEGCTMQQWAVLLDLTSASGSTTDFQLWFLETWIPCPMHLSG